MKTSTKLERQLLDALTRSGSGFERRQHGAERAWRETVTDYLPEPWLVALERERIGLPFRPGRRPAANR